MIGVVYSLSDPLTGEIRYIGQTTRSVDIRLSEHIRESKRDKPRLPVAWWIKSLGGVSPIIKVIEETDDCAEAERRLIKELGLIHRLLNLTSGGDGTAGWSPTGATRLKMSDAGRKRQTGKPSPNRGKKFSDQVRAKMSAAHRGQKGRPQSAETRAKISASRLAMGIKWTDEQRKRTIASRSNYTATPEHRANLSAAAKADWARRRSVGCV